VQYPTLRRSIKRWTLYFSHPLTPLYITRRFVLPLRLWADWKCLQQLYTIAFAYGKRLSWWVPIKAMKSCGLLYYCVHWQKMWSTRECNKQKCKRGFMACVYWIRKNIMREPQLLLHVISRFPLSNWAPPPTNSNRQFNQ